MAGLPRPSYVEDEETDTPPPPADPAPETDTEMNNPPPSNPIGQNVPEKPASPRVGAAAPASPRSIGGGGGGIPPPPPAVNMSGMANVPSISAHAQALSSQQSNGSAGGSGSNTPKQAQRQRTPDSMSNKNNSTDFSAIPTFAPLHNGTNNNNNNNINLDTSPSGSKPGSSKQHGARPSKDEFASRLAADSSINNNNNTMLSDIHEKTNSSSNPLAKGSNAMLMSPISPLDDIKDEALESVEFTQLLRQVDVGLEMTELLKEVIRKFSKHQLADASKLQDIYGKMQNVYLQMDGMQEFADTCNLAHKLILETVQQQKTLAEFLANELVPKLTQHLQEKQSAVQILKKENQQAEIKLQTSMTQMKKAENNFKNAAKRARNTADPSPRKKTVEDKKKVGLKAFTKNMKNKLKQSSAGHGAMTEEEETYIKADNLAVAYEASVMTANDAQDKHLQICRHFKYRLRAIEESRMSYCTNQVKLFANKHFEFFNSGEISKLRKEVLDKCESLDSTNDFETWISKQIQTRGTAKAPVKFEAKSYDYENAFYSLEDAMKVTRKVLGNEGGDLQVPLMMSVLCEKIKKTKGFTTEGIFRISASVNDLEYLRKRLYNNDYKVQSNDPHVSAGMLKDWLRGLKDSLIPGLYYDACVEMAKKGNIDSERLDVFISQLPEVNRESIRYLVSFLNELLAPENTKITRMNVENIAIVFAPTVLRCPREDPQLMLTNSKHEQTFMIQLIEKLKA